MRRAAFVVAAALATAGCGGSSHEHAVGAGAHAVPPNTVVFFAARVDAPHWQELARTTLHFVPHVAKGADEVDVAILQGGRRIVLGDTSRTRPVSLADDPHYRDMLRNLPRNPKAFAYVRGDLAGTRLIQVPGQVGTAVANFRARIRVIKHPLSSPSNAYLKWRWGAAWLTSHGIGVRIRSAGPPLARSNRVRYIQLLAQPYAPALPDEIPADALHVVDLVVPPSMFELMQHLPAALVARFPAVAPIDLAQALDQLVLGETALYTRPGGEVTLVSSPPDVAAASRALRELGLRLPHAFIGGQLVLSTKAAGIAAFRSGAAKLSADPDFRRSGVPSRVTGFEYSRGKRAAWALPEGPDATFAVRFSG